MTGEGEVIIGAGLAKEICLLMEQGFSPQAAGRRALKRMRKRTNGHAGAIILGANGAFALLHTTPYLMAGYVADQRMKIGAVFNSTGQG